MGRAHPPSVDQDNMGILLRRDPKRSRPSPLPTDLPFQVLQDLKVSPATLTQSSSVLSSEISLTGVGGKDRKVIRDYQESKDCAVSSREPRGK